MNKEPIYPLEEHKARVRELEENRRIKIPRGLFRLLLNVLRDDEQKGLKVRGDIANDLEQCANSEDNGVDYPDGPWAEGWEERSANNEKEDE